MNNNTNFELIHTYLEMKTNFDMVNPTTSSTVSPESRKSLSDSGLENLTTNKQMLRIARQEGKKTLPISFVLVHFRFVWPVV